MNTLPIFIGSLFRNPTQIGSIAPSSAALSRSIASLVDPGSQAVLEIGAGTGSVTQALLERGVSEKRLFAIELDERLAACLRRRFPRVRVFCGDAARLSTFLPDDIFGSVNCVVSSLPFLNMRAAARYRTLNAALRAMAPDGELLQYTYSLSCPIPSARLRLDAERVERVWGNLPPATIWRFRKANRSGG